MEKFGVDVETEATKTAATKVEPVCPSCARPLLPNANVPTCPQCGTLPFEPKA